MWLYLGSFVLGFAFTVVLGYIIYPPMTSAAYDTSSTHDTTELTAALREAACRIDAQTYTAAQSQALSEEATRAMADLISGQLGARISRRGFMPGDDGSTAL